MNQIAVSELRANLLKILKKIEHGSIINITSRGKIVATLVPPEYSREKARKRLKEISDTAHLGDIISPIDSDWKVAQE